MPEGFITINSENLQSYITLTLTLNVDDNNDSLGQGLTLGHVKIPCNGVKIK
jgi:hypothetical protein